MLIDWRLFVDCDSVDASRKLARRHFEWVEVEPVELAASPYHKGGFVIDARTSHAEQAWSECVLLALTLAQRTGHSWQLSGGAENEIDLWSSQSKVAGVTAIHARTSRQ